MRKSSDEGMFPGDWGLERRLTALAEAGFAGIEMNIGDGTLPVGASSEDTAKLRNLVESNGLSISAARGGGVGSDLGSGDAGVRSKAIETVEWYLNAVSELDCDAVLMVLGNVTEEIRHDQAIDIARSVVTEILPIAERNGRAHLSGAGVAQVWRDRSSSRWVCATSSTRSTTSSYAPISTSETCSSGRIRNTG